MDTGVDYTHPDLKNNFGPYKGYDFVDNDYDPQETPTGALKTLKKAKVNREYDRVFSGFSMKLPASEIPKLLAVKEVKAVYPNATYKPDSVKGKDVTLAADAIYQATSVPDKKSPELEKAEIYGDIDVTSDKQTTVIVELKEKSLAEAKADGEKQTKASLKTARSKAKSKVNL
ncbi:hypothetical protein DT075_00875 [Bacillus licheniformis]|nr:hypothetical protein DT075_00875 [Bacillus licheniformis]